jgi:hypothetical protein
MIEALQKRQALVEVPLRFWRTGRDHPSIRTQTFKQWFLGSEASEREHQAQKNTARPSDCFHITEGCFLRSLESFPAKLVLTRLGMSISLSGGVTR